MEYAEAIEGQIDVCQKVCGSNAALWAAAAAADVDFSADMIVAGKRTAPVNNRPVANSARVRFMRQPSHVQKIEKVHQRISLIQGAAAVLVASLFR
jgi:hypothetical protein